jgi:hypothetical protein
MAAVLATMVAAATSDCSAGHPPTAASPKPAAATSLDPAFVTQTVHAGFTFLASFDVHLSSSESKEGQLFSATLQVPLVASDGSTVAPKGAKLRGRILTIEHNGENRLVLRFDTVEVKEHFVPIRAQVMRIESARVAPSDASDPESTAASVYPLPPTTLLGSRMGGGPPPEQLPVELQPGAYVELFLSRPLVLGRSSRTDVP